MPTSLLQPEADIRLEGRFTLYATDRRTGEVRVLQAPNLVVRVGRIEVAKYLAGEGPAALAHIELGTGATTPASTDTGTETAIARSAIADILRVDNIVQPRASFIASVVTAALKEVTIWLGGTTSLGTGVLYGRALIDLDNTLGNFDVVVVYQTRVLQASE